MAIAAIGAGIGVAQMVLPYIPTVAALLEQVFQKKIMGKHADKILGMVSQALGGAETQLSMLDNLKSKLEAGAEIDDNDVAGLLASIDAATDKLHQQQKEAHEREDGDEVKTD